MSFQTISNSAENKITKETFTINNLTTHAPPEEMEFWSFLGERLSKGKLSGVFIEDLKAYLLTLGFEIAKHKLTAECLDVLKGAYETFYHTEWRLNWADYHKRTPA
tara:strand:- start:162 stop:479 length:318 start_codon:yes stop_codon:yes gene_type:complete